MITILKSTHPKNFEAIIILKVGDFDIDFSVSLFVIDSTHTITR